MDLLCLSSLIGSLPNLGEHITSLGVGFNVDGQCSCAFDADNDLFRRYCNRRHWPFTEHGSSNSLKSGIEHSDRFHRRNHRNQHSLKVIQQRWRHRWSCGWRSGGACACCRSCLVHSQKKTGCTRPSEGRRNHSCRVETSRGQCSNILGRCSVWTCPRLLRRYLQTKSAGARGAEIHRRVTTSRARCQQALI